MSQDGSFEIVSPVDGRVLAVRMYASADIIERTLTASAAAAREWRTTCIADRAVVVRRFIAEIVRRREALAELVTWQMGRPLPLADETAAFAEGGTRLVDIAGERLATMPLSGADGCTRFVSREPYGVMLSICAWNYPVSLCVALVIPPLMAGNAVIFKHAPQTALIGDVLNEAAREAGFPQGVFRALDLSHDDAEQLVRDDRIGIVGFVGSERGGRDVYAASRTRFKPFILELGGKDPVYVREDCSIGQAAGEVASGAYANSGQSCCSVERIYVHRTIYREFVEAFIEASRSMRVDHPIERPAELGPLVSVAAANRVRALIEDALAAGASLAYRDGTAQTFPTRAYMRPVILENVHHDMEIMHEETFGPVAPIMAVDSDDHAVALMNDSRFGLTASIWTRDVAHALALGKRIATGSLVVNQCNYPDALLPWGGIKASGMGRSDGEFAYESVTTLKSHFARPLA